MSQSSSQQSSNHVSLINIESLKLMKIKASQQSSSSLKLHDENYSESSNGTVLHSPGPLLQADMQDSMNFNKIQQKQDQNKQIDQNNKNNNLNQNNNHNQNNFNNKNRKIDEQNKKMNKQNKRINEYNNNEYNNNEYNNNEYNNNEYNNNEYNNNEYNNNEQNKTKTKQGSEVKLKVREASIIPSRLKQKKSSLTLVQKTPLPLRFQTSYLSFELQINRQSNENINIQLQLQQIEQKSIFSQSLKQQIKPSSSNQVFNLKDQTKVTQTYVDDFYQLILRPIARLLIIIVLIILLTFTTIYIVFVFNQITYQRLQEQQYLKTIVGQRIYQVQDQFHLVASFLNTVYNVLLTDTFYPIKVGGPPTPITLINITSQSLYKLFQLNYTMIQAQIAALMSQKTINNVFILNINQSNNAYCQFNLSSIASKYNIVPYAANTLNKFQLDLVVKYISSYVQYNSVNDLSTFYDSDSKNKQNMQLFQLNINAQNISANNQYNLNLINQYNIYCLQSYLYQPKIMTDLKTCVVVQKSNSNNISNRFVTLTDHLQINITVNTNASQNKSDLTDGFTYGLTANQITLGLVDFQNQFYNYITSEITPLYPQYFVHSSYMNECLKFNFNFYQFYSISQAKQQTFRCYNSKYLHFLVSQYVIGWTKINLDFQSYQKYAYNVKTSTIIRQYQIFVLSNQTFFKQMHSITINGIQTIQNVIKLLLIIVVIVLLSLQLSKTYITQTLLQSFITIRKLGRLVKNTQQVKQSQFDFKKILNQLKQDSKAGKIHVFQSIICYFRKFLWIKKLLHAKKALNSQKKHTKQLLAQGLNLFKYQSSSRLQSPQFQSELLISQNYQKYPSVLIYIYEEQISLEEQKIELMRNLKVIGKNKHIERKRSHNVRILQNIEHQSSQRDQYEGDKNQNEELPQISILEHRPKQNRGVRFSNQIEFRALNQDLKKSKFKQIIRSNSSIGKKSSLKSLRSVKSIESDQKRKALQQSSRLSLSQQQLSIINPSLKKLSRKATIKNILSGEQSVHMDLRSLKFDQSLGNAHKINHMIDDSIDNNLSSSRMGNEYFMRDQIFPETIKAYQHIIQCYAELVEIKKVNVNKLIQHNLIGSKQQNQVVNEIYKLEIQRLNMCYELMQIVLIQSIQGLDQVSQQIIDKVSGYTFAELKLYEQNYQIQAQLLQKSMLYKMKISICLGKTISYKDLQQLCGSDYLQTRLQSNFLYSQQLSRLQPFLDFEVINKSSQCLCQYPTTNSYKRKSIQLYINTLQKINNDFSQQIEELELIKRFYNKKHKKFYFIADMTESYDIFTPILTKIYQHMAKMDLMQVYNLGMNQNEDQMELVGQIVKPNTVQTFLSLFEQLTIQNQKSKQRISSKVIHRRMVCQKDFNQILDAIQKDETQFSNYIVVILGADQHSTQLSVSDDIDSSNNQRQLNQLLYSEINRKIQKNYYHMIMLGTNLNNFLTKQGKLKKHIKNSYDLLEIDLIKKNMTEHFFQLQKFIDT